MKYLLPLALLLLLPSCQISYGGHAITFHEPLVLEGLAEGKSAHATLLGFRFGDSSVDAAASNGNLADVRYADTTVFAFPFPNLAIFTRVTTTVKGAPKSAPKN